MRDLKKKQTRSIVITLIHRCGGKYPLLFTDTEGIIALVYITQVNRKHELVALITANGKTFHETRPSYSKGG